MKYYILAAAALASLSTAALAAPLPSNWDGLVQVPSKHLDLVYLQPGADFRGYRSVMLDPTSVAFQKDWQRSYNSTVVGLGGRISNTDIQNAVKEGVTAASDIFAKAWQNAGYTIVTQPGPDVLRVSTAIANISVTAPDVGMSMSHTAADTAGEAILVVEARDSMTNALLGRAADRGVAGDDTVGWRSSVTNRADFRDMVEKWAKLSADGMNELKALSPISR